MAINKTNYSDRYQIDLKQTKKDPSQPSPAPVSNVIKAADTLRNLVLGGKLATNTPWDTSNVYAGFRTTPSSYTTVFSILSFGTQMTGEGGQETEKPDFSKFNIEPFITGGTTNLRFFIRWYDSSSFTTIRPFHKWTNIPEELKDPYAEKEENGNVLYKYFNTLTRKEETGRLYGTAPNIFTLSPITSIEINKLIYTVEFKINTVQFTNYDTETGSWKTAKNIKSESLPWSKVKNKDHLAAGDRYDDDLWNYGFKIISQDETQLTIQYCSGCSLVGYYGDSNATYDKDSNSYKDNDFGVRSNIGSSRNQGTEQDYPTNVLGKDNLPYGQIVVMTELNISELGTVYAGLGGIYFANSHASTGQEFNTNLITYTSNHQAVGGANYFGPLTTYYNNPSYGGLINTVKEDDNNIKVYIPNTALSASDESLTFEGKTGTFYKVNTSNGIYTRYEPSARRYHPAVNAVFSIALLWTTIASMGVYVAMSDDDAKVAALGKLVGDNDNIYCGEMLADGTTTGDMIQGGDIADLPQADMDDVMEDTPYIPPAPPSDDDPENAPTPSGKGEDKKTGDQNVGIKQRVYPGSAITYYALTRSEMDDFKELLWNQPKTFYERIQIAGRQTGSIFDYISSVRYYPIKQVEVVEQAVPVYLGTGAVFRDEINAIVKFTPSRQTLIQVGPYEWRLDDEIYNWRHNFLDYSPYCKMSIYLPYSGTYDLDLQTVAAFNDISNEGIYLQGLIDLTTGQITYYCYALSGVLLLQKTSKIGIDLQVNGNDSSAQSTAMLRNSIQVGNHVIGSATTLAKDVGGAATKNPVAIAADLASIGTTIANDALNTALAARQVPVQVGNNSGTIAATVSGQDPYITVYRQKIANPENYGHAIGYLTESRQTIGNLTGYTVCRNPDLKNIPALAEEKSQIASLLTSGFFA